MQALINKKSLLIVEDEPDLLLNLAEAAADLCDRVLVARNGEEALGIVAGEPNLCAILSDISMPKMSGLELLARLRKQFNPIPFVILSGFGDTENFREAIRLQATDFLLKPFDHGALKCVLEKVMQYGFELKKAEAELDTFLRGASLPAEKLELLRRAKLTVAAMRIESAIYLGKNKAG